MRTFHHPACRLDYFVPLWLTFIATYTLAHKHKILGLGVTCGSSWNSTQINNTTTYECVDAGVIYSCTICHGFLEGKECYRKLGFDDFSSNASGDVGCVRSYNRTAYEEGGGLTLCVDVTGTTYQCSQNEKPTKCEMCKQVGLSSTT